MRIGLFLLTNLAIMVMLTVVMNVFGLSAYTADYGINFTGLLVMCGVIGFAGSFISLALSKWMAKRATGAQVITTPQNEQETWLITTISELAQKLNVKMPEVAIYPSPDTNAFATGMTKNSSLVAVSSGLLSSMTRPEARSVLAHEMSHVANGDMVTLALIQGVINTFVMFAARALGNVVDRVLLGNRDGPGLAYFGLVIAFELVFGALASIVVFWFSRRREFRADAGAARLTTPDGMIAALQRLKTLTPQHPEHAKEILAFGITANGKKSWGKLFMTHPPLDERIAALRKPAVV